ncbi:MAG: hypothetical protein H7645_07710 [Candidatus Heimdallarchaeota archaeon]|nr:hypothetical protein [Candidatus Heimdallarchaeota archaeon]MCK4770210.1 hypothetical protein [Candidatus Heimdallarchaeota archaeon]
MKNKAILGSAMLGLTIILLTVSGAVTQAQISASSLLSNQLADSPILIEEMNIVAGIDSAALVQLLLIGDVAPSITSSSFFDSNVVNWYFIASDQANYHPYLMRRPFRAPENATLVVELRGSMGPDASLAKAVNIAILFASTYGVGLMWARAQELDNGNFLYYFTGGMENSLYNTLISEIQTDIGGGLVSAISAADVVSSPVKAVIIGEAFLEGLKHPVRGIYYVDEDAITEGGGIYTLSTHNLFGSTIGPITGVGMKYSTVKFRFPYTINPLSIAPRPNNFAPQITGKMDWVLNVPWSAPRPAMDYVVTYNIDHARLGSVPRVAVNMEYNQTMLNEDGRLQMDYVVTNTGTEDAENIDISYALGPDFLDFMASKPDMPVLRDDVTINEGIYSEIDATITITPSGPLFGGAAPLVFTQTVLVLDGWYVNDTTADWVDYNHTMTEAIVKTDFASYDVMGILGDVTTEAKLSSPDGLSQILVNRVIEFLNPIILIDYPITDLGSVFTVVNALLADYETEAIDAVIAAGNDLYDLLYTLVPLFEPDLMDFSLTTRDVGEIGSDSVEQVFLNSTIPFLAASGGTTTLSWALDNIPAKDMHFGIMGVAPVSLGDTHPALQLSTMDRTGYDLMRLLFGVGDPGSTFTFSRPLSYYNPWLDVWFSAGAMFSYEDPEGFEYFGFSNGLNLQVADDEAVLNVQVSLDQVAYKVGDAVGIDYLIENTGNLDAENVQLLLVHGALGNDWQIKDPDIFWADNVGTVAQGSTYVNHVDAIANSFLGIHSVYAIVYFDSDVGQTALVDGEVDFAPGLYAIFEGAAETHQVVLSNMDWAVLLPTTEARRPAFPQPVLEISVDAAIIIPEDAPWELEVEIVITNVGESATHITAMQFYNASEMELITRSSSEGDIVDGIYYGMGIIMFQGIELLPGESITIVIRWLFLTSYGCFIPGIYIIYDSRFANELGEDPIEGDETESPLMYSMNGQTQDEQDWEDYGESTQTGTSAGADVFGGGDQTRRLGSYDALFWSIGTIIVTAVAVTLKKKIKP